MAERDAKPRILVVDDEPVILAMVAGLLSSEYEVLPGAHDGGDGLKRTCEDRPDLVLTDIAMPDMSGYELCRAIKANPDTAAIPVIFMSGAIDLEEHLAGHDAGGEDFLAKPFKAAELRYKVANALRQVEARRQLSTSADDAFRVAMTAMSSAAEMGVIVNFVRRSFSCADYDDLAAAIIAACAEFGLEACVRLHGCEAIVTRNRSGPSSALERDVLERMAEFDRIVDFSRRTAINYDNVTLMVTNMPVDDSERYGRLRDQLAILAEAADARVHAIDDAMALADKHRALGDLVDSTRKSLSSIDQLHRENHRNAMMIMHGMLATVEQHFSSLDMSGDQEDYIVAVMNGAVQKVMDLFEQGLAIDDHLSRVAGTLGECGEEGLIRELQAGG